MGEMAPLPESAATGAGAEPPLRRARAAPPMTPAPRTAGTTMEPEAGAGAEADTLANTASPAGEGGDQGRKVSVSEGATNA